MMAPIGRTSPRGAPPMTPSQYTQVALQVAAARPCMDLLSLCAALARQHKAGLGHLLRGLRQGTGEEEAGGSHVQQQQQQYLQQYEEAMSVLTALATVLVEILQEEKGHCGGSGGTGGGGGEGGGHHGAAGDAGMVGREATQQQQHQQQQHSMTQPHGSGSRRTPPPPGLAPPDPSDLPTAITPTATPITGSMHQLKPPMPVGRRPPLAPAPSEASAKIAASYFLTPVAASPTHPSPSKHTHTPQSPPPHTPTHPHTHAHTHTHRRRSSSSSSSSPYAPPSSHRGHVSAKSLVMSHPEILTNVFSFLVTRRNVGRLAGICRLWRDVSRRDVLWRPVVVGLMPVLGACEGTVMMARERAGGYRGYVKQYGRSLVERRTWIRDVFDGIDLHFEIRDAMDGLLLVSALGPAFAQHDQTTDMTFLFLAGPQRVEVVGPPFSAASRDPGQQRYKSMADFFRRCDSKTLPTRLAMRVVARDRRSGRMALLWESGKETSLLTEASPSDPPLHPDGSGAGSPMLPLLSSLQVQTAGWTPVFGPNLSRVDAVVMFVMFPQPSQDHVPEEHRLWRMGGGMRSGVVDHGLSSVSLLMRCDREAAGRFVASLFIDA